MGEHDTHLGARARQVRTKHDGPGSLVVELLAAGLETILEEFDVATTAVAALLVLDLVLDDERLAIAAKLERARKRGGDGVVGGLGLGDEALIVLEERLDGVLDLPLADIAEGLAADGSLLGRLGGRPPRVPVLRELFQERRLDFRGL